MIFLSKNPRKVILFLIDLFFSGASLYLAYYLRWDGTIPHDYLDVFNSLLFFVFVIRSLVFVYFGLYSRFWEYSTLGDLVEIVKAVVTGSFLIVFVTFIYDRNFMMTRSIVVIDIILLVLMIGGSRLVWRSWRERMRRNVAQDQANKKRALILGAGSTGALLLRYLREFDTSYSIMGFIDDDPRKLNNSLMGETILGDRKKIQMLAETTKAKELLIAIPGISPESLNEIIRICRQSDMRYKMVASVVDLSTQEVHISRLKNIETNDLLGRDVVSLDLSAIKKMIQGKRVLVTGAGGSIGSQLCSHILEHSPELLVMLDKGENYLFDLKMLLTGEEKDAQVRYCFTSVTDQKKMELLFSEYRPQLVFHAAAHKHVPLMEENIDEAIINNIQGTKIVADLADKFEAEKFILVSTDKVVQPKSVMGMTKKIAENYSQVMAMNSKTQFIVVRFGNVLGSNGSIGPLLQRQIEKGGPVTITDPEMERYFMLIPEAVQLVLQAGALGTGGEIFLLEMGKPVKILDLAKKMIRLAGYIPGEEIEIKFIGCRPGEKLSEELIDIGEEAMSTTHRKISLLRPSKAPDPQLFLKINHLCREVAKMEPQKLRHALFELATSSYRKTGEQQKTENQSTFKNTGF